MKQSDYKIGDKVHVKCNGSDVWALGTITGVTSKRVRVFNDVRAVEGFYAYKNVVSASPLGE